MAFPQAVGPLLPPPVAMRCGVPPHCDRGQWCAPGSMALHHHRCRHRVATGGVAVTLGMGPHHPAEDSWAAWSAKLINV